jgi:hypothetical protein
MNIPISVGISYAYLRFSLLVVWFIFNREILYQS